MKYHAIAALAACLCAGALSAQATLNFTGTVSDLTENLYKFDVDFGSTPQSISLTLQIGATGGTSGLDVNLVDLDELAANGTTNAVLNDSDAGTGTMTLSMTTPTYSGVHQFAVQLHTNTGSGSSPFSGDLSAAALSTGAITQSGFRTIPFNPGYYDLLGRGARRLLQTTSTTTVTNNVQIDFGTGTQAITFWAQGLSFDDGTVTVHEVDDMGGETLLATFTLNSTNSWEDEGNFTTSPRTGIVTLRFRITATTSSVYFWQLILPAGVSSVAPSGGGGGGGGDGGCSTGEETNLAWLGLLALVGAFGVAVRLRA